MIFIPTEIWREILNYITKCKDHLNVALTCKLFNNLIENVPVEIIEKINSWEDLHYAIMPPLLNIPLILHA